MHSMLLFKLWRHGIYLMAFCALSFETASFSSPNRISNVAAAQLRADRRGGNLPIVPGRSSGNIQFGMPQSKVRSILGSPAATIKLKNGIIEDYWADRSRMRADALYRAGSCIQIEIMDPRLRSRDGIGSGAPIRNFFSHTSKATMAEYGYDLDTKAVEGEAPALPYVTPGEVNVYFYDAVRAGVAVEIGTQDEFMLNDKPDGIIVHKPGHPLIIPTYGVFNHAPHRIDDQDDNLTPAYLYAHASTKE